jgi:hypothetical protein
MPAVNADRKIHQAGIFVWYLVAISNVQAHWLQGSAAELLSGAALSARYISLFLLVHCIYPA